MNSVSKVASCGLVGLLAALSVTQDAHAYLDPGTGSMILQVVLGGVAGLMVAGKLFWTRILAFFSKNKQK